MVLAPGRIRKRLGCVRRGHSWRLVAYGSLAANRSKAETIRYCRHCGRIDKTWD
jgi:hypothetical protein